MSMDIYNYTKNKVEQLEKEKYYIFSRKRATINFNIG